MHDIDFDPDDCLIDSTGGIYNLTERRKDHVYLKHTEKTMTLNEILGLVKAHAAHKGTCCVAKLYAPSIIEAFKIVESLEET